MHQMIGVNDGLLRAPHLLCELGDFEWLDQGGSRPTAGDSSGQVIPRGLEIQRSSGGRQFCALGGKL